MQKWRSADKVALRSIERAMRGQKGEMDADLHGQLDEKFQKWASAQKLREFPRLVKMVGLTQKGYFLGVLSSDLHAWQSSFTQKQLTFLKYAAKRSGVEQVGVAVLPPTPFSFDPSVEIDQGAILGGIAKGLGFGASGSKGTGGAGGSKSKFGSFKKKGSKLFQSVQKTARKLFASLNGAFGGKGKGRGKSSGVLGLLGMGTKGTSKSTGTRQSGKRDSKGRFLKGGS
jgi:hypothetical protein